MQTQHQKQLTQLREKYQTNHVISQHEVHKIEELFLPYRSKILANEKEETFDLLDDKGQTTGVTASRWLCHLIGFPHKSANILFKWTSPKLGSVFILQVRSWEKSDAPGAVDLSIGGHVTAGKTVLETAYQEMEEEMGISIHDVVNQQLENLGGKFTYTAKPEFQFYNHEWSELYLAELKTDALEKIYFQDGEVVGLYFCPEKEAINLLKKSRFPLATALQKGLTKFL